MPQTPVIDLFAGPGGLGEGFSLPTSGEPSRFKIALSIEKDPTAHQTLELRAAYRFFEPGNAPAQYYSFIQGHTDRAALYTSHAMKEAVASARAETWNAELGAIPKTKLIERVRVAVGKSADSVLIGGPPCQAYSLVGRSRNLGNPEYRPEDDKRHSLYLEYLRVLAANWPAVFVMENVKGLLSAQLNGHSILSRILEDLHDPTKALRNSSRTPRTKRYKIYALAADTNGQVELINSGVTDPKRFVVRCEEYGIPQARHRVILIGVREDLQWPAPDNLQLRPKVSVRDVIDGLPAVRSGLSGGSDSRDAWLRVLDSCLKDKWTRQLRTDDPELFDSLRSAVDRAHNRKLDRGAAFVERAVKVRTHADWYVDSRLGGVLQHTTRAHIAEDIKRYLFASGFAKVYGRSPLLNDFPVEILPNHRNVGKALNGSMFHDRFRVQLSGRPATTITSHISKDGHYYIHYDPMQCRSLTAREAARIQTFPDNYFFCGGRTSQYQQIGNAVPPLLAKQIAELVAAIMS